MREDIMEVGPTSENEIIILPDSVESEIKKGEKEEIFSVDIEELIKLAQDRLDSLAKEKAQELLTVREKFTGEKKYIVDLIENIPNEEQMKKALMEESAPDYKTDFYQEFSSQEVVSEEDKVLMERLQSLLQKFEEKENPTDQDEDIKEKLKNELENATVKAGVILAEKRDRVKNKWIEVLTDQVDSLKSMIKEIEEIPEVRIAIDKAERENQEAIKAREEEARKKGEESEKAKWEQVARYSNNLSQRNKNAIERISELVGDGELKELKQAFIKSESEKDKKSKRQSAFNRTWNILERQIMESKKAVTDVSELCPWAKSNKKTYASIHYGEALNYLRGNVKFIKNIADKESGEKSEKAKDVLKTIESISIDNQVIFGLIGSLMEKDGKTEGRLLQTIKRRKKNDIDGVTEKILAEKDKFIEQREKWKKEVGEIVRDGGFVVVSPVRQKISEYELNLEGIGGFKIKDFTEEEMIAGDTRPGRRKINKGQKSITNTGWEVEQVVGYNFGVSQGQRFDKDFTDAPSSFKKAAKGWARTKEFKEGN